MTQLRLFTRVGVVDVVPDVGIMDGVVDIWTDSPPKSSGYPLLSMEPLTARGSQAGELEKIVNNFYAATAWLPTRLRISLGEFARLEQEVALATAKPLFGIDAGTYSMWAGEGAGGVCECGAHKIGVGRGQVGHSSWCPWSVR